MHIHHEGIDGVPGLAAPTGLDGISFAKTVKQPDIRARENVVHVYPRGQRLGRAIRTARYRLVEWKQPGAAVESADLELYDYQIDPLETKNLAADNPEIVAQMREILARHPEAKPSISDNSPSAPTAQSD